MPNSDSQISDVIFLNPSFTTFSSKINVQIMILKEFSFLNVQVESYPENTDKLYSVQYFLLNRSEITKAIVVDL